MRLVATFLAALAMLALAVACSSETIVLATVKADAGASNHHAARCLTTADCVDPRSDYCQLDNDGDGHCFSRPLLCDEDFHAVCAPSGITYFNDCYRRQAGEGASTNGECQDTALRCNGAQPCPGGAVCALVSYEVEPTSDLHCGRGLGTCWGIITCPEPAQPGPRFDECAPAGTTGERCLDVCRAVQTGKPFTKTMNDAQCQ